MADFCAKIRANASTVEIQKSHNRHVCVEDESWWILQVGEQASEDASIIEYFAKDPLDAARHIRKDCAYVALRKSDQTLFVARDPFGFIPIRYARNAENWVVWTGPKVPEEIHKRVNYEKLAGFITRRPDTLEEGYFIGVNRILPGHCIRFTDTQAYKHKYYEPDTRYSEKTLKTLSIDFREALFSAIPSTNLLALSGGLDSTSLLAGMSKAQTHTMFSSRFKSADERQEIDILSTFFNVKNTLFDVDKNQLWTHPDQFHDDHYQGYGPIFHPPVFGEQAFFGSMLTKNKGPIITGIGGDNVLDVSADLAARRLIQIGDFAKLKSLWKKFPQVVKRQLVLTPTRSLIPGLRLNSRSIREGFPWIDYPLKNADRLSEQWGEARLERILSWSWEQVTRLLDSHGRAIGSPILSPWMSSAVWNVLLTLPPEMLFYGERHKGFLRYSMKGFLPEKIRTASKSKHFGKPTEYQFLKFKNEILSLFDESSLEAKKLIKVEPFKHFLNTQISDISDNLDTDKLAHTMRVWPTIAAEIWLKNNS